MPWIFEQTWVISDVLRSPVLLSGDRKKMDCVGGGGSVSKAVKEKLSLMMKRLLSPTSPPHPPPSPSPLSTEMAVYNHLMLQNTSTLLCHDCDSHSHLSSWFIFEGETKVKTFIKLVKCVVTGQRSRISNWPICWSVPHLVISHKKSNPVKISGTVDPSPADVAWEMSFERGRSSAVGTRCL